MFKKVVIANRGDVTSRIIRTLRTLGIQSVAVYSKADEHAPYLRNADETYFIGESKASESYLNQDALLDVIQKSGADAVHPGYGFLSENAVFARRVQEMGVCFIGPSPKFLEQMANKSHARDLMRSLGLPVGLGSPVLGYKEEELIQASREIGLPVLVKPAGGGGGIGMYPIYKEEDVVSTVERARKMAMRTFSSDEVYFERYMENPRHIEFQVIADQHGDVRHLFERDCSIQRRHQKVIEEAPAPNRSENLTKLAKTITDVLQKLGYDNIGTVEMLFDEDGSYSFLEMNTRLQVEHAVTEEITGIDLVEAQIRAAAGEKLADFLPDHIERKGHAIEARVYAEDPNRFLPSPGPLRKFNPPVNNGIRVETGYEKGSVVTPFYDPMIAKVIVHDITRKGAIEQLTKALTQFEVEGIKTNLPFLIHVLQSNEFSSGNVHTNLVSLIGNRLLEKGGI
ncbi:acetyl-CoA carboxylase biotin carboxylase subunit [Priestia endophytica]|uniref:acetyl-CoA carboxylase biotin carboxylase subunit n=1 Tax=Priestia endophytica TaxID=135735 RepID=UPI000DCA9662|nr:biotin carboxylase N-terminal domain-containing protein [Priestia endophytica]RAS75614.1 biotin carboxylase [Priestia endophytica]